MRYAQLLVTGMLFAFAFMAFFTSMETTGLLTGLIALTGAGLGLELYAVKYRHIK